MAGIEGVAGPGQVPHLFDWCDRDGREVPSAAKHVGGVLALPRDRQTGVLRICLSAILAAVMSTASAQLLVASSAFAEDFYKGIFKKNASQKELLWTGRLAVLGIAILALLLASDPDSKVLELVAFLMSHHEPPPKAVASR